MSNHLMFNVVHLSFKGNQINSDRIVTRFDGQSKLKLENLTLILDVPLWR